MAGLEYGNKSKESLWWRDLLYLIECMSENLGVSGWLTWRLGNGNKTLSWYANWFGAARLCDVFPTLFSSIMDKGVTVSECGEWGFLDGSRRLSMRWHSIMMSC